MPTKPKVVAFDIIETVFSLESLQDRLVALGLPETALEAWFAAGGRGGVLLAGPGPLSPLPLGFRGARPPPPGPPPLGVGPPKTAPGFGGGERFVTPSP